MATIATRKTKRDKERQRETHQNGARAEKRVSGVCLPQALLAFDLEPRSWMQPLRDVRCLTKRVGGLSRTAGPAGFASCKNILATPRME